MFVIANIHIFIHIYIQWSLIINIAIKQILILIMYDHEEAYFK